MRRALLKDLDLYDSVPLHPPSTLRFHWFALRAENVPLYYKAQLIIDTDIHFSIHQDNRLGTGRDNADDYRKHQEKSMGNAFKIFNETMLMAIEKDWIHQCYYRIVSHIEFALVWCTDHTGAMWRDLVVQCVNAIQLHWCNPIHQPKLHLVLFVANLLSTTGAIVQLIANRRRCLLHSHHDKHWSRKFTETREEC